MNVNEPRVRRRGFFLHSSDAEAGTDTGVEHDNPEGFSVRARLPRSTAPRQFASSTSRGRQARAEERAEDTRPQIRSGSVTGSRQRAH